MERISRDTLAEELFIGNFDVESVYAIDIAGDDIVILADMESVEAGDRIEEYGSVFVHNDWLLDHETLESGGLAAAVSRSRGENCGGIYFHHEEGDDDRPIFDEFIDVVANCSRYDEYRTMAVTTKDDNYIISRLLKDGCYIFHLE